jgi:hypothetical protein
MSGAEERRAAVGALVLLRGVTVVHSKPPYPLAGRASYACAWCGERLTMFDFFGGTKPRCLYAGNGSRSYGDGDCRYSDPDRVINCCDLEERLLGA